MSWSIGFDELWKRDIGYGVIAYCDFPGCEDVIDRGLSYVCCGAEPYGGGHGCGLYFCDHHHPYFYHGRGGVCSRCKNYRDPFPAKADHPDWIRHKLTDESWAEWRADNPDAVADMKKQLESVPA